MKILNNLRNHLLGFIGLTYLGLYPTFALAEDLKVTIVGVNKAIEENIRSSLSLLQEADEIGLDKERIEQEEARAKQEIQLALQPFGYYNPTITTQLNTDQKPWVITYEIQLNEPIKITRIDFHLAGLGSQDPALQSLLQQFSLHTGDVFVHETYEQGKKTILTKVIESGYLNAMFTEHRVEVNTQDNTGQIYLVLETGPRHYFGPITFSSSALSPKFLQRYVPFKEGDVYEPEKTLTLQSELTQSDYFAQVNVKTMVDEHSATVPVLVELQDAKPNQYILGAGYGTDTGIRGKVGWNRRQINSYGHRVMALAQVSEVYDKFELDYIIPGKHPSTDQIKFKGGYFEEQYSDQPSRINEIGLTEERSIFRWKRRLGLIFLQERYNAFATDEKITNHLLMPSITFIQTTRNDVTAPTNGRRIELTMRGAGDGVGSDVSFFQAYLQIRWLHSFNEKTKGLLRTEAGFTLPSDVEDLPLSQRFFAGGDLSLRGYGYRTLPLEIVDGKNYPPGGGYLGIISVELSREIKKPFGLFTFIDAGNAFRELTVDQIECGTGLGIEWKTRLGPIKFAVAKPLTKHADSWRIHASFGPEL